MYMKFHIPFSTELNFSQYGLTPPPPKMYVLEVIKATYICEPKNLEAINVSNHNE
jgi:hypothetical protein